MLVTGDGVFYLFFVFRLFGEVVIVFSRELIGWGILE